MPYKTPTSFTAKRRLKLSGVVYGPGEVLPMDVVKGLRKLDVLVANGWIVPDRDPFSRRGKPPRPYVTPPGARAKLDVSAPAGVTGLVASDETGSAITLSWTNPATADFEKVVVRRATGAGAPATYRSGTAVTLASDKAQTVTVTGLASDTQYSFSVFARDDSGNFSAPALVTASTLDVTAPGAVTGLAADAATDTTVDLSWTNPVDADLDHVVVRRAAGATAPATVTSGVGVTLADPLDESVTDTGLTELTEYSWSVFAVDGDDNVSVAASVTASTVAGG